MLLFILSPASSSYSGCLLYSCCCSLYSITLQENNWISRPTSREVEREIEKGRRNSSGNWTRNQSDTHSVKSSSHLFSKKRKIKKETNLEGDGWRSTRSKSFSTVSMTDTKQRGPRCTNICISLSLSVCLPDQTHSSVFLSSWKTKSCSGDRKAFSHTIIIMIWSRTPMTAGVKGRKRNRGRKRNKWRKHTDLFLSSIVCFFGPSSLSFVRERERLSSSYRTS